MSAADTRDEILTVSARLFEHRGIAGTTMRAIADACDIKAASLYHHFASKDEIVAAVLARSTEFAAARHAEVTTSDPRECIVALARATLDSFHTHPEASRLFAEHADYVAAQPLLQAARASARAISRQWIEALRAGQAAGVVRTDLRPELLWDLLRSMLLAASRSSPADHTDVVIALLTDGVLVPPPRVTARGTARAAASRGARPSPNRRGPSAP